MYCVEVAKARAQVGFAPIVGTLSSITNYYSPEENCLASGMSGGKGLCNICGEISKWKKNGVLRKHTTKCCPYKYHFDIRNRKQFVDAMAEMIKFCYDDKLKESYETNNNCNHTIKNLEDECITITNNLKKVEDNNKFIKELFSKEEIKQREEQYNMMKEEIQQIKTQKQNLHIEIAEEKAKHQIEMEETEEKLKAREELLTIQEDQTNRLKEEKGDLYKSNLRLNTDLSSYIADNVKIKNDLQVVNEENEKLLKLCKSGGANVPKFFNEYCSICCDNIGMDDGITTPCGHHFHFNCYGNLQGHFLKTHSYGTMKCPNCNQGCYKLEYN